MLPDKPSALIRLALSDLRKVEAQPDIYAVSMDQSWHIPFHTNLGMRCVVCLAGAVIAGALGADPQTSLNPSDYSLDIQSKLFALDMFRLGEVRAGVRRLFRLDSRKPLLTVIGLETTAKITLLNVKYYNHMPNYDINPTEWKAAMIDMANDLEAIGL